MPASAPPFTLPTWLALATLLYVWIGLTPFIDLSSYADPLRTEGSNLLNQIVALCLFGGVILSAGQSERAGLLFQPRGILVCLFFWLLLATVATGHLFAPEFRRFVLAFLLCVAAAGLLMLPASEAQFRRMLLASAAIVLSLCYLGVLLWPDRSIHLATDYLEPELAGDWRGLFEHKNAAAPAMALLVFVGFYLMSSSPVVGFVVAALAAVFLLNTGGKTALGMLIPTLAIVWLLERLWRPLRYLMVVVLVAGYGLLSVGAAIFDPLRKFVEALGIDATFTGRTDIWTLALQGIARQPLFGYGYDGFWGTEEVVYAFRENPTWAGIAPAAHNSYLDVALTGGLVALVLTILWLVISPVRNLSIIIEREGSSPLTRLYVRTWIFGLLLSAMESVFIQTTGPVWFFIMLAVSGLWLQAHAQLRRSVPRSIATAPMAAA